MNEGFGMYMNIYKGIESLIMIGVLLIKNEYDWKVFEKDHSELDIRLFFYLRIFPGLGVYMALTLYIVFNGNFNYERYKDVQKRNIGTLIDVKSWDVIKSLIERREVESLRRKNADKIFCKLRNPTEEGGIKITIEHLRERNFSIGDMCRLQVPMEKLTNFIEWQYLKQPAIKRLKQRLKKKPVETKDSKKGTSQTACADSENDDTSE